MAAPVKPENKGTPIPDKRTDPPSGQSGSPSSGTPETSPPAAPPTEGNDRTPVNPGGGVPQEELDRAKRLIATQEATLRDYNRSNAEMAQRLREMESRLGRVEAPPPSQAEMDEQFWKEPTKILRGMIKEELHTTVGPINERLNKAEARTTLDIMKDRLRVEYGDNWKVMEPLVDNFVTNAAAKGVVIDEQVLDTAALTAWGALSRGRVEGVEVRTTAPTDPPPPKEESRVVTPPHLRPSAPSAPSAEPPKPEARQLTENEARLARERGWTPEQYLAWLDVPPEKVVHSDIGRKKS